MNEKVAKAGPQLQNVVWAASGQSLVSRTWKAFTYDGSQESAGKGGLYTTPPSSVFPVTLKTGSWGRGVQTAVSCGLGDNKIRVLPGVGFGTVVVPRGGGP